MKTHYAELQEVSQFLAKTRKERGISLVELAKRMGLKSHKVLSDLENGKSNPTLKTLQSIARALDVTLNIFSVDKTIRVCCFNHAGGSSKSSITRDLGYGLSQRGFKVLLIDTDAQANLTTFLGPDSSELKSEETVIAALSPTPNPNDSTAAPEYVLPSPIHVHGMDLIPANIDLAPHEGTLPSAVGGYQRLGYAVERVTGYDFILIDSPPNLGPMSISALLASDFVIMPVQLRKKFRDGLITAEKTINNIRQLKSSVKPLAIIPTQTDTTAVSRENYKYLLEEVGPRIPLLPGITRRPAIFGEAEEHAKPVAAFEPQGDAAAELDAMVDAFLELPDISSRLRR